MPLYLNLHTKSEQVLIHKYRPLYNFFVSGNPFFYGGMIKDPRYFAGRKAELERIFSAFQHLPNHVQHVNVVGPRRMGKSSLLWQVKLRAPNRVLGEFIYLDGQRLASPEDFFQVMSEYLGPPNFHGGDHRNLVENLLRNSRENAQTVVLLLDEFEALIKHGFPSEFFDILRSWMNGGLLGMVAASHIPISQLVREWGIASPFFNLFVADVRLGPLPEGEAEELLKRGKECDRPFTDDEVEWMKRWAREGNGYHPAKLQLAGWYIYEAKVRGSVDLQRVDEEVRKAWALVHPRLPWYRHLKRGLYNLMEIVGSFVVEVIFRKEKGRTSQVVLRLSGVITIIGVPLVILLAWKYLPVGRLLVSFLRILVGR